LTEPEERIRGACLRDEPQWRGLLDVVEARIRLMDEGTLSEAALDSSCRLRHL